MSRSMLAALTLASLAALSAPVFAQNPAALANWNDGIQPVFTYQVLSFLDENGVQRTLYYRDADLPEEPGMFAPKVPVDAKVPLFELDPHPSITQVEMTGQAKNVARFEKNKLSQYYIAKAYTHFAHGAQQRDDDFLVARYDRPGERLPAKAAPHWTRTLPGLVTGAIPPQYKDDASYYAMRAKYDARMLVLKPDGVAEAAAGPMTAGVTVPGKCAEIPSLIQEDQAKEKGARWYVINRGLIPEEMEYWAAPLGPGVEPETSWKTDLYVQADGALNAGDFSKARQYISSFRAQAKQEINALVRGGQAPAEGFMPAESRLLACRMEHMGPVPQKRFYERIGAIMAEKDAQRDRDLKAFVGYWRLFLAEELQTYLNTQAQIPALPQPIDLTAYEKDLQERTNVALVNMDRAEPPATPNLDAAKKPSPVRQAATPPPAKKRPSMPNIDPDALDKM